MHETLFSFQRLFERHPAHDINAASSIQKVRHSGPGVLHAQTDIAGAVDERRLGDFPRPVVQAARRRRRRPVNAGVSFVHFSGHVPIPFLVTISDRIKGEGRLRREVEIEPPGVAPQGVEEAVDAVHRRRVKLLQLARPGLRSLVVERELADHRQLARLAQQIPETQGRFDLRAAAE